MLEIVPSAQCFSRRFFPSVHESRRQSYIGGCVTLILDLWDMFCLDRVRDAGRGGTVGTSEGLNERRTNAFDIGRQVKGNESSEKD